MWAPVEQDAGAPKDACLGAFSSCCPRRDLRRTALPFPVRAALVLPLREACRPAGRCKGRDGGPVAPVGAVFLRPRASLQPGSVLAEQSTEVQEAKQREPARSALPQLARHLERPLGRALPLLSEVHSAVWYMLQTLASGRGTDGVLRSVRKPRKSCRTCSGLLLEGSPLCSHQASPKPQVALVCCSSCGVRLRILSSCAM